MNRIFSFTFFFIFLSLFFLIPNTAFAWGPGVHTLISFNLLDELRNAGSFFYPIVQNNFWEFLYGSLAPDFMVAKKYVSKKNNSHNFDFANNLMKAAQNEQELAFACGYLSHLTSDKIMHEVFLSDYNIYKSYDHMMLEFFCDTYYSQYLNIVSLVLKKRSILDKPLKSNIGLTINTFVGKRILKLSSKNLLMFLTKNILVNSVNINKQIVDFYIHSSLYLSKKYIIDYRI